MKHLFIALFFFLILCPAFGQNNIVKTAGVSYTAGAPTFTPGRTGSQVAIDTVTGLWYEHNGTSWSASGYRVQTISGCSAPAYTPAKYQSRLVINACTAGQGGPELYYYTGSAWLQINEGQTYTAGTGIDITAGVISNTAPGHTLKDGGTSMTARTGANFISTSTVAAALTDDAANGETEVRMTVPTDGITATELAANSVGSSEIAADAVGSSEIATDAVDAAEIASNAVGASELASTAVTAGTYGSATQVPAITTDSDGRLTGVTNTSIIGLLPSGITGQTLRHNGSSWIANNIIVNDGTNIDVSGNINMSGGGAFSARKITFSGYGSPALVLYDGGATERYGWGLNSNEMQFFIPSGAGRRFSFRKGGDQQPSITNELIAITSDGNLGINASTPSEKLEVNGNILLSGGSPGASRYVSLGTGYGSAGFYLYEGGAGGRYGMGINSSQIQFFVPTSSGNGNFSWNKNGDFNASGTNELMRLTTSAQLGINTPTPTQTLDVNGNARLRFALYDGTNSAGSSGNILSSTGSATQWKSSASVLAGSTYAPTGTADALGTTGDFSYDSNYIYVKTPAGWKRAALSTF